MVILRIFLFLVFAFTIVPGWARQSENPAQPNIVFILIDDLRHDVFGYAGHPFVETPSIDRLAEQGVRFESAYVTSSLCSPARASFLTGQYMHHHRVVDNQSRIPVGTVTFPQLLQQAGYATAFMGKWHMGGTSDAARPGFDRWVSFKGQGAYMPEGQKLNVDGELVTQKEYMTDELTRYAVDWLQQQDGEQPFMLYLSHKGVHGLYDPAPRHRDRYRNAAWQPPASMADSEENYTGKPMWVRDQRNSWHGVEFAYHGRSGQTIGEMYRHYCEMVLSIDESVGQVLAVLEAKGLSEKTVVVFTSDGGHLWGEHGLIDKRCAYEESIRIPMIVSYPSHSLAGEVRGEVVSNIDMAPTLLELAKVDVPEAMDGHSFANLLGENAKQDRDRRELLYEYYWEPSFPQTPTVFALREDRYKLVQSHGVWDRDELYDLKNDPEEMNNLIDKPDQQMLVKSMRRQLYERLKETDGLVIPLGFKRGEGANKRRVSGSERAEFPEEMLEGE